MYKSYRLTAIVSAFTIFSSVAFASVNEVNSGVDNRLFNHMDLSASVGTSGLELELTMPCTKYLQLRAGGEFMPRFDYSVNFGLQAYKNGVVSSENFDKMQELAKTLTGYEVDQNVEMIGTPKATNFKFMVDLFPIPNNRHWYVSAGFYYGAERVASALNSIKEMPSLLAVGIYNMFYDNALSDYYLDHPIYGDVYLDPEVAITLRDKMENIGRMGIHLGDYKDGTPYMMEPDVDGLVKVKVLVNKFKPYLGVGYMNNVADNGRLKVGFDCGVMFWGGTPNVVTHDGVNLSKDVVNLKGKVGDYVDVISAFKVYPVLNFRISYTIF